MRQILTTVALAASTFIAPGTHVALFAAEDTAAPSPPARGELPNPDGGTPATVVDDRDAGGVLGRTVRSSAGEDMGRIVDIIVNRAGQVRAAIIDFGGFLGVGSRKIAVAWDILRFPAVGQLEPVTVELTRDQVRLAPEFLPGEPIVVLGSPDVRPSAPLPRQEK